MIANRYSFPYDFVYGRIEKSANLLASQLSTEIWQMLKNQISRFPTRTRRGTCRSTFLQFLWIFFDTLYAWQWLILASKGLFLFLPFLFTDRSPQNLTKSSFFIWKLIESHADYRLSLKSNAAQQNIDAYLFAWYHPQIRTCTLNFVSIKYRYFRIFGWSYCPPRFYTTRNRCYVSIILLTLTLPGPIEYDWFQSLIQN